SIDDQARQLRRAAAPPGDSYLVAGTLAGEQASGMNAQVPTQAHLLDLSQRLLWKPMAMHVPVGAHVAQKAPLLSQRQAAPQSRCDVANESDCLPPVPALALGGQ